MLEDLLKESSFSDVMADLLRPELEAEGMRKFAQEVLESRFGPLPEDMQAALNKADMVTLKALAAHISADSLEEIRAQLGLH